MIFLEGALKRSEETKVEWEKKLCMTMVSVETWFILIQERSSGTKNYTTESHPEVRQWGTGWGEGD